MRNRHSAIASLFAALRAMCKLENTITDVDIAFQQLEFAIKLMCYCELGHLDIENFDTDVTILLEKENVGFKTGSFSTKESVARASKIQVGVAFGVSAIILDAAYEAAGIRKNINLRTTQGDLQIFVYMIRCAFAHNMATPIWQARGADYARAFSLPLETEIKIDLSSRDGEKFDYAHIGGFAQWFKIKDAVLRALRGT